MNLLQLRVGDCFDWIDAGQPITPSSAAATLKFGLPYPTSPPNLTLAPIEAHFHSCNQVSIQFQLKLTATPPERGPMSRIATHAGSLIGVHAGAEGVDEVVVGGPPPAAVLADGGGLVVGPHEQLQLLVEKLRGGVAALRRERRCEGRGEQRGVDDRTAATISGVVVSRSVRYNWMFYKELSVVVCLVRLWSGQTIPNLQTKECLTGSNGRAHQTTRV